MNKASSASAASETTPEGARREELARYFLSVPAYRSQSPAQKQEYCGRLRQLGELEDREILQTAGSRRPLIFADPIPLIQNVLTAAQRLAAGVGQPLLLFPAKEANIRFPARIHPRLLTVAIVDLLRSGCAAAPGEPLWVRIREQRSCLTVTATAAAPFTDPVAADVIKECARLHGGSPAQCETVMGFSCSRAEEPSEPGQPYRCPTAEELIRDTLSPVWTGFYSWLFSGKMSCSSSSDT